MNLRVEKKIIDNYRVRAVWYSIWKDEEMLFETAALAQKARDKKAQLIKKIKEM